ncbi:MAG TPA: glycosyltransferase family 4 protein, partial [Conexibacter sp.]|nr:glycosyltransferase family 4 protein [Conexibacter sp.]
ECVSGVEVERFRLPDLGASPSGLLAEYALANVQLHARGLRALRRGTDVVHLHNPPDTLFPLALVARALGRRVVFDHHDLAPELFTAKFGNSPLRRVLEWCEHASIVVAHLVLAANESHREIATRRGRGRTPVAVVRNGPPRAALAAAQPPRAGELRAPALLFLGSMESQDGVDELPRLLVELRERHRLKPTLTLVGDGSRRTPVAAAMERHGFARAVRFTGRVAHTDVPGLLAQADICLDPAPGTPLNHRSTMVKVAEYLAARRPVVAYDLRETRRTAGDAARYAPCDDPEAFADAVAGLARDSDARLALAERAHARADALVWERSESQLLDAYAAVLR